MTTDEALDLVRQTEKCWIIFDSSTGEVLDVIAEDPDKSGQ
ncbi:MAG: hypothetical protein ABIY70_16610 [Capsulimonas sp.]